MSICFFNADSVELFTANFCGTLLHDCTKLGQVQGCFIHVDDQFFGEVVSLSQCPNSFYQLLQCLLQVSGNLLLLASTKTQEE